MPNELETVISPLEQALEAFNLSPPTASKTSSTNRWILASAMQKSIRRGHTETAIHMCSALAESMPSYFWYRISIVAMEDILLGDIQAVKETLQLAADKEIRSRFGNDKCAAYIAYRLASSGKDRSACDSIVYAGCALDFQPQREAFPCKSIPWLTSLLKDRNAEYAHRIIAARQIAGGTKGKPEGHIKFLLHAYHDIGVPDDIIELVRIGFMRKCEGMPVALGLVHALCGEKMLFKPDPMMPHDMLSDFPSYTFDKHTSQGKLSLIRFAEACAPMSEFIARVKPHDIAGALGSILFRIDGDCLDQRIQLNDRGKLRYCSSYAFGEKFGIPKDSFWEGVEIMRENFSQLQDLRKKVWPSRL